ncbi:hypothetical protein RFI_11664 [Reticulomyxa filosa]|uniref:BAH domain-containing protein n=1 Tax=Reticulomyxa filosa TaxID=46433 RepID=X6NHU6_RETFI|nr:hypothetical protein RFI_11664 [Reticulomyxa filosa]|eukprot:ETO25473.1 hypothetical protein RFI_11664 [Reticulomyxa filosa]
MEMENEENIQKLVLSNNQYISDLRQEMANERNEMAMSHLEQIFGMQAEHAKKLQMELEKVIFCVCFFLNVIAAAAVIQQLQNEVAKREEKLAEQTTKLEKSDDCIEKLRNENEVLLGEVERLKMNQVEMQNGFRLNLEKFEQQETEKKKLIEKYQRNQHAQVLETQIKVANEGKVDLCQSIEALTAERNTLQSKLDMLQSKHKQMKLVYRIITNKKCVVNIIYQRSEKELLQEKLTKLSGQIRENEVSIEKLNLQMMVFHKANEQVHFFKNWRQLQTEVVRIHTMICQIKDQLKNEEKRLKGSVQELTETLSQVGVEEAIWTRAVNQTKEEFECNKKKIEQNYQKKLRNAITQLNDLCYICHPPLFVVSIEKRTRERSVELLPNPKKRRIHKTQSQILPLSSQSKNKIDLESDKEQLNACPSKEINDLTELDIEILGKENMPLNSSFHKKIKRNRTTDLTCSVVDEEGSQKKDEFVYTNSETINSNRIATHNDDTKFDVADLRPKVKRRRMRAQSTINTLIENPGIDTEKISDDEPIIGKTIESRREKGIYWCGRPTRITKGKVYFKKVWINGIKYRQYDKCQVFCPDNKIRLAKILDMFEERESRKKYMETTWYCARADLLNRGLNEEQLPKELLPNEIFECIQPSANINPLTSIRAKVIISYEHPIPSNNSINESTLVYSTRYFYDPITHEFTPQTVKKTQCITPLLDLSAAEIVVVCV